MKIKSSEKVQAKKIILDFFFLKKKKANDIIV